MGSYKFLVRLLMLGLTLEIKGRNEEYNDIP
jgi:hypothetical protein